MTIELKQNGSYLFSNKVPDAYVSNDDFIKLLKNPELRSSLCSSLAKENGEYTIGNLGIDRGTYYDSDPQSEQYIDTYNKKRNYGFFAKC
jgi:hypothetical protein